MKKLMAILALAFAFLLGACGAEAIETEVKAATTQDFSFEERGRDYNNPWDTFVVVDETTGVNYIVVYTYDAYGTGLGITPRYHASGSLYTSK